MKVINSEVETGEAPVVNSRYSIVLASAKRARQLIAGADPLIGIRCPKPLSIAVDELYNSKIRILSEEEAAEAEAKKLAEERKKAMNEMTFSFEERKRKRKKSSRGFKMDNEYKNEDRKESLKTSDEQKAEENSNRRKKC